MVPAMLRRRAAVVLMSLLFVCPVLAMQEAASCNTKDFYPYWQSVFDGFLREALSASEGTPRQARGIVPDTFVVDARLKTGDAAKRFSVLLHKYPELCQLQKMESNDLSHGLFILLIYQQAFLNRAFERKQISAEYLSEIATTNPHFTSNLLGHLSMLVDLTHTLEVSAEQQRYFTRLAFLVKDSNVSHKALRVFSQAFSHLMLLINEGQPDEYLERYAETITDLRDDQFDDFLQLDKTSTAGIYAFLLKFDSNYEEECRWLLLGKGHSFKIRVCGNIAFYPATNTNRAF